MQKTLDLTADPGELGELYAELSFESTMRGAMWKVAPDWAIVVGWIRQTLEHAPPDSRPYAYGLVAKAMLEDDIPAAELAIAIAERLDDVSCSPSVSSHTPPTLSTQPTSRPPPSWRCGGSGSSRGSTIPTTSR